VKRLILIVVPLFLLAGCGGSTKPNTGQTGTSRPAAQTKPDNTYQEVKEAEEHIYPGQPLLGKAWGATRLHMIAEFAKDYRSARPEGTACGTLHTLPEEALYVACETKWKYEGEQYTTRSWVTVSPHRNVNVEAVAQGPTTSPTGHIPIPMPSSTPESTTSTPSPPSSTQTQPHSSASAVATAAPCQPASPATVAELEAVAKGRWRELSSLTKAKVCGEWAEATWPAAQPQAVIFRKTAGHWQAVTYGTALDTPGHEEYPRSVIEGEP
jgi:hypothetical protein